MSRFRTDEERRRAAEAQAAARRRGATQEEATAAAHAAAGDEWAGGGSQSTVESGRSLINAIEEGAGERPEADIQGPRPIDIITGAADEGEKEYVKGADGRWYRSDIDIDARNDTVMQFVKTNFISTRGTDEPLVPYEFAQHLSDQTLARYEEQNKVLTNLLPPGGWEGAHNWTTLEFLSFNTGMPVDFQIELEAAQAAFDEYSVGLAQAEKSLAKGQAFQEILLNESEPWLEFHDRFGDTLGAEWMDVLAFSMNTNIDMKRLETLVSEYGFMLEQNPEWLKDTEKLDWVLGEMIMRSHQLAGEMEEDRLLHSGTPFLTGLANFGLGIADPLLGPGINFEDQGILTGLGQTFQPFEDAFIDPARRTVNSWFYSADPDNVFRPHLTMGQNIAFSLGADPGSTTYNNMSGAFDLLSYLAFDPLTYVGGIASGVKNSMRVASQGNKWKNALKAVSPIRSTRFGGIGRDTIGMGWRGNKGITARVTYSLLSRNIEDLMGSKLGRKFADEVFSAAQKGGDEILDAFPELANNPLLATLAKSAKSSDEIQGMIVEMMHGVLKDDGTTLTVARRAMAEADAEVLRELRRFTADGTFSVQDLAHTPLPDGGAMHAVFLLADEDIAENGIRNVRLVANGEGGQWLAWSKPPRIMDLTSKSTLAWIRQYGDTPVLRKLKKVLLEGGDHEEFLRNLNVEEMRFVETFISNAGYDMLGMSDNTAILGARTDNVIPVFDDPRRLQGVAGGVLNGPLRRQALARQRLALAINQADETWHIGAIPKTAGSMLPGVRPRLVKALRSRSNTTKGRMGAWWTGHFEQANLAKFSHQAPKEFDLFNVGTLRKQIQAHGRRAGVDEETISRWVREMLDTDIDDRAQFIGKMLTETAEEVGDLRMLYGIRTMTTSHADGFYLLGDNGTEVARGTSKTRGEQVITGKPHRPGMLGKAIPGLDEEWYKEMDRLRKARKLGDKGAKFRLRGATWTGTNKRRADLVAKFRRVIQKQNPEQAAKLSDDDLYALAFATIENGVNGGHGGLGVISQAGQALAKHYGYIHRGFNVMALGLRPITWPLKVVFGEEQARAQLVGLTSLFHHPIRHMNQFYDARLAIKAKRAQGAIAEAYSLARSTAFGGLDALERQGAAIDDLLKYADDFVDNSGFDRYLAERLIAAKKGVDDIQPRDIRIALGRALNDAMESDPLWEFGGRVSYSREAEKAVKLEERALARIQKRHGPGISLNEMADDFGELVGDLSHEVANAHVVQSGQIGLSRSTTKQYSIAKVDEILGEIEDPFMAYALERRVSALRNVPPPSPYKITGTTEFRRMRTTMQDIASQNGKTFANDTDLALWYFDTFYKENLLDARFRQFTTDAAGNFDNETALGFYQRLQQKEIMLNDEIVDLRRSNQGNITRKFQEHLDELYITGQDVRHTLHATAGPSALAAISGLPKTRGWHTLPGRILRASVRKSGSDVTQAVTRRPGYLNVFDDYYRHYTEGLGWSPEKATAAARMQAVKQINEVMYNMADAPEMLTKFNSIVPFGAAQIEVAKVWFWQLPVAQSYAGLGHFQLFRKVDRFEKALEAAGMVERDSEGNTTLRVDIDGKFIGSQAIARMLQVPALAAQQLSQFQHHIFGDEEWAAREVPKQFTVQLGLPIDPTSEGIMAMNRFSIGSNPVMGVGLNWIANQSWLTSASLKQEATRGMTLGEIAEAAGLENTDDLFATAHNRDMLRKGLGEEIYYDIMKDSGKYDLDILKLTADVVFEVPNTNATAELFDHILNPYGRVGGTGNFLDDMVSVAREFVPSTFQNLFKSFAIGDKNPDSFTGSLWGGLNTHSIEGGLLTGMAYANMHYGVYDEAYALQSEAARLTQKAVDDGVFEVSLETGRITQADGVSHDEYRAVLDEVEKLQHEVDEKLLRGMDAAVAYAAQDQLTRAITGFMAVGSPRGLSAEMELLNQLWDGRELADAIKEGQGQVAWQEFLQRPHKDLASALDGVRVWFENDTSSAAKQSWAEWNPGLEMFLTPKRVYNGDPFPEYDEQNLTDYIASIERGEVQTLAPEAFLMSNWHTKVTWEKHALRSQVSGLPSGFEQGQWALQHWGEWSEIDEITNGKRRALQILDQEQFGGAYAAVREVQQEHQWGKKTQEQADLDAKINRNLIEKAELKQQIEDLDDLRIDPEDKKTMREALFAEQRMLDAVIASDRALKEDYGYGDDTDKFISMYFDGIYKPYKEAKQKIYDVLHDPDTDLTDAEVSTLYGQLREIENATYWTSPFIMGLEVPNPLKWVDTLRDEESRIDRRYKAIWKKPQWLNVAETRDLMSYAEAQAQEMGLPMPRKVLPTTREDLRFYTRLNDEEVKLKDRFNRGEIDEGDYNKAKKALEKWATDWLVANKREAEAWWLYEASPADRLTEVRLMPESLETIAERTRAHIERWSQLKPKAKNPAATQAAEKEWRETVWPIIQSEMTSGMREDLIRIGMQTLGNADPQSIVESIFLDIYQP